MSLRPHGHLVNNGDVTFLPGDHAPARDAPHRTEHVAFQQFTLTDSPPAATAPTAPAWPSPGASEPAAPVHLPQPDFTVSDMVAAEPVDPDRAFGCAMAACVLAKSHLEQGSGTLFEVPADHVELAWNFSLAAACLSGTTGGVPGVECKPCPRRSWSP